MSAGDVWGGTGNGFAMGTGVTVGLAHVVFSVDASAVSGAALVALIPSPATTLSDIDGNLLAIDNLNTGTITINGSVVPEPSSFAPLALLLLVCGGWLRRK
jgi:hypothetical protein